VLKAKDVFASMGSFLKAFQKGLLTEETAKQLDLSDLDERDLKRFSNLNPYREALLTFGRTHRVAAKAHAERGEHDKALHSEGRYRIQQEAVGFIDTLEERAKAELERRG
jgi:hypothetical protein